MCRAGVVVCAAATTVQCASDTTGPKKFTSIGDLQGTWTLTEWKAVGIADPAQSLDLLAELSVIATLDVFRNDSATLTVSLYGQTPTVDLAFLSLSGDTLSYDGISNDGRFLLSGSGDFMTWRGIVPQLQDVNGDGIPEATFTHMAFRRTRSTVAQMMH